MWPWQSVAIGAALAVVPAATAAATEGVAKQRQAFDIQAHRGGLGLRSENTLSSFGNGLRVGVTTLELDIQITEDGQAVVTHDRRVTGTKCLDTAPPVPGDPEFPYVGKYIKDLTLAQVRTLDCGSLQLADKPAQETSPGSRMPLLSEVFALVRRYHADDVMLNIETKVEAGAPHETAPREQFVQVVVREIREAGFPRQVPVPGERIPTLREVFDLVRASGRTDIRFNIETKISPLVNDTVDYRVFTNKLVDEIVAAGLAERATIQSFDWRTILLARHLDPRIETVALVWQYGPAECASLADECSLRAVYGDPSVESPWTAGHDWWHTRDLGKLTVQVGASTVSSNWQVHDPNLGHVLSPDWYLKEDPTYFHGPEIATLHDRYKLKVVPYTVNDEATMQRVIDLGVDGIISDDPDLLVAVAKRSGLR